MIATLALAMILAAPVPIRDAPKPLTREDFVGDWILVWGTGRGRCQFAKDGSFFCQWYGVEWRGDWSFDGNLRVREAQVLSDGSLGRSMSWPVKMLQGKMRGTLESGGDFSLSRPSKKKPDF